MTRFNKFKYESKKIISYEISVELFNDTYVFTTEKKTPEDIHLIFRERVKGIALFGDKLDFYEVKPAQVGYLVKFWMTPLSRADVYYIETVIGTRFVVEDAAQIHKVITYLFETYHVRRFDHE
jgi:hypothetical protein